VTHITPRLTAKSRDQLRNPTLGNRVWATFTFLLQLKGHPVKRLNAEVNRMIGVLRLEEKRNVHSRKLSGGMKRKLSVGIALIAGSKVPMKLFVAVTHHHQYSTFHICATNSHTYYYY